MQSSEPNGHSLRRIRAIVMGIVIDAIIRSETAMFAIRKLVLVRIRRRLVIT